MHTMRLFFCFLVGLFLTIPTVSGQELQFELKTGLLISTLSGESASESNFDPRTGLSGGIAMRHQRYNGFGLQVELLYSGKGSYADGIIDGVPVRARFDLTYIEVPLLLTYRMELRGPFSPRFMVGPSFARNVDALITFRARGSDTEFTEEDSTVEGTDWGIVLGTGVEFLLGGERVFLEARGFLGQSNVRERDDFPLYNRSVGLLFGITF